MENVKFGIIVPENCLESIINIWVVIKGDSNEPDSQSFLE
jgi:hypothetical protein